MGITFHFKEGDFMRDLNKQKEDILQRIENSFIQASLDFVVNARGQMQDHAMGQYKDQTTNLRNSIQCFVFRNGEEVYSAGDSKFATENKALIRDLIKSTGFQLIAIAGMNYASHVESKGYNVISYQVDQCILDLTGYLENLEIIEKGSAASFEDTFTPDELPQNFKVSG